MKFFLASSAHQLSASSYGVGSASPLLCAPILSLCLTRRSSRPAYGGRLTLHVRWIHASRLGASNKPIFDLFLPNDEISYEVHHQIQGKK